VLDSTRLFANDLLADVIERADDGVRARIDAALADARDAGVSIDDAEDEAAIIDADCERLYAGDLYQDASLPSLDAGERYLAA
jgi:hypothetical protein